MSRFFDDKVLSDDQICEESCKNGQVSPESRYNDYRNRLPFHYIEDGENDGYYYWTYGATMELSIILSDDVAWGEDKPVSEIEVDDELSETSENPVQNKVITEALNGKLDKSTEKTILDQAYIKTAAGDNSRLNISIKQLPLTLVERDVHGHVMTSKADSEGQAVAYEQLEQRVPAGGKKGQNLTKKSDNNYDIYWADPNNINSIEHITLNGEEVPIEDKTANIKVDAKTVGFESANVAYTDKDNTFTEPQTFDYTETTSSSIRHEYAEIGAASAHYYYTEENTDGTSESGEAFISSLVGRISVNRSTNDNSGTSKRSLTLDVNKNWIARNELTRERIDGNLGTPVQTYYAYKFPKTYPNKEVTLATIEDLDSAITDLDKEHIAYVNKENTFTERQHIVTPYDSDISTQEEGFIDAGIINVSRIKYTDDTKQYYTDNDAILNARYLQLKQQIKNENGLTQHIIQLDHDGIKQVDYDNNSNTNYGYTLPKTYPNKNVTLATIEDLTAQLDTKLDKAGGTISGSLIIAENLTVQGKTTSVDTQNLKVADKLIYVAKDNTIALTSPAGLITPKYDGTNNGGIVYDHTGTAYVGDITLDSNGNVDVDNSDLQPIATRNAAITDGNIVEWNNTNKTLVDSGKAVDNLSTATNLENGTGDVLIQTTDSNQSFKVMTDGRAKVQSAPAENDDVLRLNEFSVLTQEQVNSLF